MYMCIYICIHTITDIVFVHGGCTYSIHKSNKHTQCVSYMQSLLSPARVYLSTNVSSS